MLVVVPLVASMAADSVRDLRLMVALGATVTWLLLHAFERSQRRADLAGARAAGQARFAAFFQHSSDVVTVVDPDNVIRFQSASVQRVFGHRPEDVVGKKLGELLHPEDRRRVFSTIVDAHREGRDSVLVECRVLHADGDYRQAESAVSTMLDDPEVNGVILNTRDISERKALEDELARQAFHDSLTRLANRALLRDRIAHALARSERRRRALAVLWLDLDGFKLVNDSLGHKGGDELLVAVAGRLLECVRPTDTAARLGGDEFAVLLEDLGGIGVAMCEEADCDPDEILRNADVAMYAAKARGKNCVEVFRASMHAEVLKRLDVEADLRRALERHEFVLHYQPTVVLQTGRIVGVEALVRWRHPTRGLVPPLEFIPVAEETGLVVELGAWVLGEACRQATEWHREHPADPPLTMAVNLSARQLQSDDLVETVAEAIQTSGIEPSSLVLEITETAVMNDHASTIVRLKQLKKLGVRLAIDDFGTGYSSLSYLRRFPIDVLKIDRSFVDGVCEGSEKQALLRTIVELGRALRLETVAEGIEVPEELDQLRSMDCELGQGFYFARPVEADDMPRLLRQGDLSDQPARVLALP
ncbi:MAG: EAL domain-containing protein [Actinobacteria bacterium]|nr:EAL domain-containing protein [Actinomycetota bacterium]